MSVAKEALTELAIARLQEAVENIVRIEREIEAMRPQWAALHDAKDKAHEAKGRAMSDLFRAIGDHS